MDMLPGVILRMRHPAVCKEEEVEVCSKVNGRMMEGSNEGKQ